MPEDHRGPVGETHPSFCFFVPSQPSLLRGRLGVRHTQALGRAYRGFLAEARRGMRVMPLENIGSFDIKLCGSKLPTEGPKS